MTNDVQATPMKWGVIGVGFMGKVHVKTLQSLPGSQVVAVADIDPEALSDIESLHQGIRTYASHQELLADPEVEAVLISAPNRVHKEIVIDAAKAGKKILCEKPVALDLDEFDEMMKAVDEAGVPFTVHQQRRFDKDFNVVKAAYEQGLLGDVYTIQSSLYGYNGNVHDWHVYAAEGGGMLYDWGVHLIDQALYLMPGKLKTVYADLRNVINEEVDDYFKILLRFDNDVVFEIELGTYFLADKPNWFERHWFMGGNKGTLVADKFDPEGSIVRTTELLQNVAPGQDKKALSYGPTRSFGIPRPGLVVTEPLPEVNVSHADFFANLFDAWNGKGEILVKPHEVRRCLAVMEAVRESARTGRSVDFEV